jgi:hypothetical protein
VTDINEIITRAVQLLNEPSVRAVTTVVSILVALISFSVSVWAFRRTSVVMSSHFSSLRSEQARFIEVQWNAIDQLTVANSDCSKLMVDMFGIENEMEAKRESLHYMFLNILGAAFVGWKNGAIDHDVYDGHMRYFFLNYKGRPDYLIRLVEAGGYIPDFKAECMRYMALARDKPTRANVEAPQKTQSPTAGVAAQAASTA